MTVSESQEQGNSPVGNSGKQVNSSSSTKVHVFPCKIEYEGKTSVNIFLISICFSNHLRHYCRLTTFLSLESQKNMVLTSY